MLHLLLNLAACANVVRPGICTVTIDDQEWDFRDMAMAMSPIRHDARDGYQYIIKLCGELTSEDVGNKPIDFGTSVARCKNGECQGLVYMTDFDYRPELPHNLTDGLIYVGDGNLFRDSNKYYQVRVLHNFHCDPSSTSTAPEPSIIFEDLLGMKTITLEYQTNYGCPVKVLPPTPTPDFAPDCEFVSRIQAHNLSGIDMDLSEINNGPYGLRYKVKVDTKDMILFHQPCGRGICPIGADCLGETYSSTWLCSTTNGKKLDKCTSYGVQAEKSNIVLNGNEYNGIVAEYDNPVAQRSSSFTYKCSRDLPQGYVIPADTATIHEGHLFVALENRDVCVRNIPFPQPPSTEMCKFYAKDATTDYKIISNLQNYNKEGGISTKVVVDAGLLDWNRTLIYQPCAGTGCPDGFFCEGDEDATVWLCEPKSKILGQRRNCVGYGLFEKNVTLALSSDYIMNGFMATYKGDHSRKAVANWKCNKDLTGNDIIVRNRARLYANILYIDVESGSACAQGSGPTPTPIPVLRPPLPSPSGVTPTPNPSPNSQLFFHNLTHYVFTNLENLDQTPFDMKQIFVSRGKTGPARSFFSPWTTTSCPKGYDCRGFNESNIWTCWQLEDYTKVCHQSGYKNYKVEMNPLDNDNLDSGYMVSYEGAYGVGADIRVGCINGLNPRTLSNLDQRVTFHHGLDGFEFEYSTDSDLACPREFESPLIPIPRPTNTPNPNYKPVYTFEVAHPDGRVVKLDLNEIPTITEPVYIGYGNHFESNIIHFSPIKQVSCLDGYDCLGYGPANAWKCFTLNGKKQCFPIGDTRYALKLELINDNLMAGISANYEGGLGGYELDVHFQCNRTVKPGKVEFDETGLKTPRNIMILYAHTQAVCLDYAVSGATFGAIFIFVLAVSSLAYVAFGMVFVFATTGAVSLPNAGFWSEFAECFKTGSAFVLSLGKRTTIGGSYDSI